jgi:hypothetical protein
MWREPRTNFACRTSAEHACQVCVVSLWRCMQHLDHVFLGPDDSRYGFDQSSIMHCQSFLMTVDLDVLSDLAYT